MIFLTSCGRQSQLLGERERLEAAEKQAIHEIQTIEQRILGLGTEMASASINLERQSAAAEQKAALLQSEIDKLEETVRALEITTREYSAKVAAYKARYLR